MIADYFNYSVPMKERMTAVSLFAGVGGFDLALERNGVDVVASAEIDKHARAILAKQFPNQKQFDDVRKVNANELRDAGFIPERGIITGGFPCQDLSVAGKRAGLAGARSGLFYEIARIADETKAKWLVLENVPGLLSSQRGADMGAVVGTLVDLGYGVAWRVLDAQHFGVPQRRRRVFIVAERAGNPSGPAEVLFKRQGLRGDSSQGGTSRQETAGDVRSSSEVAGSLTANGFRCDLNKAQSGHLTVVNRMTAIGQYAEDDDSASTLMARDYKDAKDLVIEPTLYDPSHGDGRFTIGVTNTLAARMGTGGNCVPVLVEPIVQTWPIDEGREIEKHQNGLDIGNDGDPAYTLDRSQHSSVATIISPTLTAYNMDSRSPQSEESQRIVGSVFNTTGTVRRLTPTECERLQGFPDGWTEGQADSHRYKQMGNAVAVPVVEWVIQGIMEVGR